MTDTKISPYVILAGIDYSPVSELALERALELTASGVNAELHVVHVNTPASEPSHTDSKVDAELGSKRRDNEAIAELDSHIAISLGAFEKKRSGGRLSAPMRVFSHLRSRAPAQEIAQLASDLQVDLVVVGMSGRSAFSRYFLGSVAATVARIAPCPVLVFRSKGLAPEYPKIEPPCPRCVETRRTSAGALYWCEQHRERHGPRHVYHQEDLVSRDGNLPLISNNAGSSQ